VLAQNLIRFVSVTGFWGLCPSIQFQVFTLSCFFSDVPNLPFIYVIKSVVLWLGGWVVLS
jgi:hypothetical protein